jgi:hypothetical protein
VKSFALLKTRDAFITLIQNGDLEKILPLILSSEGNRDKFASFIKISYNEAKKQSGVNSKKFIALLRNLIKNLMQKGLKGDKKCADFIHEFFTHHIIQNGFEGLQAVEIKEDGSKAYYVRNNFYEEEKQAVAYGNPSMFLYLTKLLMVENKQFLMQHPALICDIASLSLAYALHLGPFSSKLMLKYTQITLELSYFTIENLKGVNLVTLQNLLKNKFLLYTCESMKNKKINDKATEVQKLLTEMYVNLMKIKEKAAEMREQYI